MLRAVCCLLLACVIGVASTRADEPTATTPTAQPAQADRIRQLTETLRQHPADKEAYRARAAAYAAAGNYASSIADCDAALRIDPEWADLYDERGSVRFMAGQVRESIDDFDRFIKLKPRQEPWHWKRGISYYYAGRFEEGQRQFEAYQTVADNDVENAVWRYLCMARRLGATAARESLLKIKNDPRVPMSEVYLMFAGKLQPDEVFAAARSGSPAVATLNSRLFYAELYVGLFHEAAGDADAAQQHISTAREHKISHYMWNVADVHARLLEKD